MRRVFFRNKTQLDDLNVKKEMFRKGDEHYEGTYIYDYRSKEYIHLGAETIYIYDTNFAYKSEIELDSLELFNYSRIRYYQEFLRGYLPNSSFFIKNHLGIIFINSKKKESKVHFFNKELDSPSLCISAGDKLQFSVSGHLFILNQKFEIIERYSFPEFPENLNSYKDKDGNIWLNNKGKGVVLLPSEINYNTRFLEQKQIQKINKFGKRIIVGEQRRGVYFLNANQDTFVFQQDLRVKESVYQMKYNKEGRVFQVVSNPSYIIQNDSLSRKNKFSIKDTEPLSKEEYYINAFKDMEISDKYTYVISGNYFIKQDLKQEKPIYLIYKIGLLTLSQYKGKVYAGGTDGLFLFEKDSLTKPRRSGEVLEFPINCSRADDDFLYVGTDGRGIYMYDGEKAIYLKNTDGLVIQKIIRKKNKLWLATQEGVKIVTLNPNELEESEITDSYYDSDGLFQNNTNDIYLEDSLLWIATDIGLSRINTKSSIYKRKTPVVFDFNADTVIYHYDRNSQTSIGFTGLNYTNQKYLKYEYRLLPSNKEWKLTTSKSISFSGLSPNLYTVEVKVTDQHNNQSIGRQYIHILPAWWQTAWARGGLISLVLLLLYILIKYIQSRIRVVERKKTKLAGLELQALRSQMNPHFVHNSLNAIKYFIQRNESELSEEYLVKFSKLIRLFFDFSRRENITLKEELLLLTLYLQIEQLRFEEKLSYSFEIDEKIDQEEELIPSMLLQPLVENAVNHGVFHKKGNGTVIIKIDYIDANSYQVIIEDDGIGITKAKTIYKNSSENYQSKSSEVIKERLELLNQSEEWNITYTTLDLSENAEKEGTRVSLLFKTTQ